MAYTAFTTVTFGPAKAGLGTVGYRLYNADGSTNGARVATGITERSPGTYGATITFPDSFVGEVRWDTGEGTPAYASSPVNPGDAENLDAKISSRSTYAGGDTSGVTTLLTRLPSVLTPQAIWDAATSGLTTAGSIGRLLANNAGTGANLVTVTVTDGTSPLLNAIVRLTQGINSFVASTNSSGVASFALDSATYGITITKAAYQFSPSTIVVTGSANFAEVMTVAVAIGAPADPSQITGFLTTRNAQGLVQPHTSITFQLATAPGNDSYKTAPFTAKSDTTGLLQVALRLGATYRATRNGGAWVTVTVPSSGATFSLPQILGDA
jgi:hypothetical protein